MIPTTDVDGGCRRRMPTTDAHDGCQPRDYRLRCVRRRRTSGCSRRGPRHGQPEARPSQLIHVFCGRCVVAPRRRRKPTDECRLRMPTTEVDDRSQRRVPTTDADYGFRRRMLTTDAHDGCRAGTTGYDCVPTPQNKWMQQTRSAPWPAGGAALAADPCVRRTCRTGPC